MTDSFPGVISGGFATVGSPGSRDREPESDSACPLPLREGLRGARLYGDRQGHFGGEPQGEMRAEQHENDCTDRRSESPLQDSILQDVAELPFTPEKRKEGADSSFAVKCRCLSHLAARASAGRGFG